MRKSRPWFVHYQQVTMEGPHVIRRAVEFEVAGGAVVGMGNGMVAEKLTKVGDEFGGAMALVDANDGIGDTGISVGASATRKHGIELAVDERDIRDAFCVAGWKSAHPGRQVADDGGPGAIGLNARDAGRWATVIRAYRRNDGFTVRGCGLSAAVAGFGNVEEPVGSEG
jgi:hypothetical protein